MELHITIEVSMSDSTFVKFKTLFNCIKLENVILMSLHDVNIKKNILFELMLQSIIGKVSMNLNLYKRDLTALIIDDAAKLCNACN